jgi:hypothetical protein
LSEVASSSAFGWLSNTLVSADTWALISVVQNGTVSVKVNLVEDGEFYDTGVTEDKSLWFNIYQAATLFNIGYGAYTPPYTPTNNLKIDDFRCYDFALSDEQLATIYNDGNGTEAEITQGSRNKRIIQEGLLSKNILIKNRVYKHQRHESRLKDQIVIA